MIAAPVAAAIKADVAREVPADVAREVPEVVVAIVVAVRANAVHRPW